MLTINRTRATLLAGVAAVSLGMSSLAITSRQHAPRPPLMRVAVAEHARLVLIDDSSRDALAHGVTRDPFRGPWTNEPGGATPEQLLATSEPGRDEAAPVLTLQGVVGGPPWLVIVRDRVGQGRSTILVEGDSVAGHRVTRINPTSVEMIVDGAKVVLILEGGN